MVVVQIRGYISYLQYTMCRRFPISSDGGETTMRAREYVELKWSIYQNRNIYCLRKRAIDIGLAVKQ